MNAEIGRWILLLSSLTEVEQILEIGTWNGAGSSQLIARGVASNPAKLKTCKVIGLEIDENLSKIAKKNLGKYSFFTVLRGTIVNEDELDFKDLVGDEKEWINEDIIKMKSCKNILADLPLFFDLVILDGGEFSTYAEFKKLEHRITKFLILDDTRTRKSRRILEEIESSNHYEIIFKSAERNGTAVVLKKGVSLPKPV